MSADFTTLFQSHLAFQIIDCEGASEMLPILSIQPAFTISEFQGNTHIGSDRFILHIAAGQD